MNRRPIYLLIGLILILSGVATALYFAVQKQKEVTTTPNLGSFHTKKVLDVDVVSPVGSFDNNSLWFFNSEGHLFQANPDGSNLSEYPLPALPGGFLKLALWPKNNSDFIVISGTKETLKNFYDSKGKAFISLAKNIQYLDWLPDGKRIVYVWKGEDGKNSLIVSDGDGTGYKIIADLFYSDLVVKAGNDSKTVLLYRSSPQSDTNKIYSADLDTGEITTLVDQGKNVAVQWLANGDKFLYEGQGQIYLYDIKTKKTVDLKLSTTMDKVTTDLTGRILYANRDGKFIKMDLTNVTSETYFEPANKITVSRMFLVGNTLYYVDVSDSRLYMITR